MLLPPLLAQRALKTRLHDFKFGWHLVELLLLLQCPAIVVSLFHLFRWYWWSHTAQLYTKSHFMSSLKTPRYPLRLWHLLQLSLGKYESRSLDPSNNLHLVLQQSFCAVWFYPNIERPRPHTICGPYLLSSAVVISHSRQPIPQVLMASWIAFNVNIYTEWGIQLQQWRETPDTNGAFLVQTRRRNYYNHNLCRNIYFLNALLYLWVIQEDLLGQCAAISLLAAVAPAAPAYTFTVRIWDKVLDKRTKYADFIITVGSKNV